MARERDSGSHEGLDLSSLSLPELKRLYADLEEYELARRRSPVTFYQPNPIGQDPFHRSPKRIRILLGGNRSGKSTAGINEDIAHSLGYRPWLAKDDPDYIVLNAEGDPIPVPNTGTVLGESFKVAVGRTLWPTFEAWLPNGLVKRVQRNQQGVVDKVEFTNGSSISFMAYNQMPKEFEGFREYWSHYDEPPPRNIFIANERSLVDFSGRSWFTLTPVRQPWIWQDLVTADNDDVDVFQMSSFDNPYVSRKQLDYYFANIKDEGELRSRQLGEALHLQGRVFPHWKAEKPYYIPYFRPPYEWARACAIDPHPRKPIAIIWVAISPTSGFWYAYRESYSEDIRTVKQCADFIKDAEKQDGVDSRKIFRIIDPSSQENEKTSDSSVYEQFMDLDIFCELALKWDKDGRIRKLGNALSLDPVYKRPNLVVMDSCRRLKYELLNYIWDDWSLAVKEDKDPKAEVVKKDDDLIDGLMYLLQWGEEAADFDPRVRRGGRTHEERVVRPDRGQVWR